MAVMVGMLMLVGAAACGSGDGAASSVMPAKTQIDSGDQARAKAATLVQDDFPAAFHSRPSQGKSDSLCIDGGGLTITGSATSDDFIRDDAYYAMFATSKTVILNTEEEARTFYARSQQSEVVACLAKRIVSGSSSSDNTWKFADSDRVDGPQAGEQSFTTRLRFTVTANGQTGVFVDDWTIVRVGNAVSAIALFNLGEPFDQTSLVFDGPGSVDLVQAVASRMQQS